MVNIMDKKINLVLGGGGASGIASVGVLIELLTNGFNIVNITGTSAGALLGGIYAAYKENTTGSRTTIKYFYDLISEDFEKFKDKNYLNFIEFYGKKLIGLGDFSSFGLYHGKVLHS